MINVKRKSKVSASNSSEQTITQTITQGIRTEIVGVNKSNFVFGYYKDSLGGEILQNEITVIDSGTHLTNTGQTLAGIGTNKDNFNNGNLTDLCYNNSGNATSTNLIYYGFDLGIPKSINKILLYLWNSNYKALSLKIQGSNDMITWVNISDYSSANFTGVGNETPITDSTAYRYIRPYIFSGSHPNFVTLSEMKVFEDKNIYKSIEGKYLIEFENNKMYITNTGLGIDEEITIRYK